MKIENKFLFKAILLTLVIAVSIFGFQSCSDDDNESSDQDGDGIVDVQDNCPMIANSNQGDMDNDGIGDACDDDNDNDGIIDFQDNCPLIPNPDQYDVDGDGIGDLCDDDSDNDGIIDSEDNCPFVANPDQADVDENGIGDICDDGTITPINPCLSGMAGIYPCNGYDLMGHISTGNLGGFGAEANDSWGWTDPTSGKEYALVGMSSGVVFVDITNTENLVIVGRLRTATVNSSWRDVKVYNNYAFIVSEASGHGMQVFDLTRLRNVANPPESFTEDARYTGFGSAHNIVINESSGYAYAVGTQSYTGGAHFVNIRNPLNPVSAGGLSAGGYSHDAQVITYDGPDSDYAGKEILIGSNENEIVIANISDKNNPVIISTVSYSNIGYTHQGWFTNDLKYFILGDELDELNYGNNTRTLVFDFNDLDNPTLHITYEGPTAAIDHNGYIIDNMLYLANYTAGVRFIDISGIASGNLSEVGFFDTYPNNNSAAFHGVWNVYPYFASGNIVISDIEGGLFIVRKSGT